MTSNDAYDNGLRKGTEHGRRLGRLEVYQEMERRCLNVLPDMKPHDSPQYVKQVLSYVQRRIADLRTQDRLTRPNG